MEPPLSQTISTAKMTQVNLLAPTSAQPTSILYKGSSIPSKSNTLTKTDFQKSSCSGNQTASRLQWLIANSFSI